MNKKESELSVKDLFSKTRAELLDIAKRMGVDVDSGTLRAGLIAALASALRGNTAARKVVGAGVTAAQKVALKAGTIKDGLTKNARKAGAGGAAAGVAVKEKVAKAVKKTAEKAGRVIRAKKAAARTGQKAAKPRVSARPAAEAVVSREVPVPAPVGGETPPPPVAGEKVVHGTGEADWAKFSLSEKPPKQKFAADEYLGELPDSYGSERFFVVARDPYWLFLYWDLSQGKWDEVVRAGNGKPYLRISDVTDVVFDGTNAHKTIEYELPYGAKNWYAYVNAPGRDFVAELGSRGPRGFVPVLASRRARMPPDDFSSRTDAQFVTIPMEVPFARLREILAAHGIGEADLASVLSRLQASGVSLPFEYLAGAEGGMPQGEFIGADGERYRSFLRGSEEMLERLKREAKEAVSSGGVSSFSAAIPRIREIPADDFFLEADAEVTVHGRTRPGARVTVGGRPVEVDADGRFRVHAALPDGPKDFPVAAESGDGRHKAGLKIAVSRTTTEGGRQ